MALRMSSSRVSLALRAPRAQYLSTRFASAAAAAVKGSSLPQDLKNSIVVSTYCMQLRRLCTNSLQRESGLPTPDPHPDSKTAGLVNQQLPYMVPTYVRPPPMFEKGEGCYMWDIENRKYLDFTAGIAVNALGHCDPGMAQVLGEQVCPEPESA